MLPYKSDEEWNTENIHMYIQHLKLKIDRVEQGHNKWNKRNIRLTGHPAKRNCFLILWRQYVGNYGQYKETILSGCFYYFLHNAKQQSTRIVCNISYSGSHHCLSSTSRARPCESQPSNPAHRIPFSKFHNLHAKKSDETKHAPQSTLTQNNITVLKDGAFWGLSKVRILQTLTLQSQASDIAQDLTLWQSLCLSLIPIMI